MSNSKGITKKIADEKIISFLNKAWNDYKQNPEWYEAYLDSPQRVMCFKKADYTSEDEKKIEFYYQSTDYSKLRFFNVLPYLKKTTFYNDIKDKVTHHNKLSITIDL